MARERTPYQQRIIRDYYRNLDAIAAQRLGELVTDLWLARADARRERLWGRVEALLAKTDAPPAEVRAILDARDVEALARLVGRS